MNSSEAGRLLRAVARIARAAGEVILEIYDQADHGVRHKADDSPLTAADLASHRLILEGLRSLEPVLPVLSEEGAQRPVAERQAWDTFWLVDPLDGTKEFVKRNGEFTVNIALMSGGAPILGVVYAPVLDRTYLGEVGWGAWCQEGGEPPRPIAATGTGGGELAVVASRSHRGELLQAFLDRMPAHRLVSMGSSLKLCLVAAGEADIYPRLAPTMEWDTAAAHAVVRAAGGEVVDVTGEPLAYNKEHLLNPHFLVLGQRHLPWQDWLARPGSMAS